uniref:Uncharacterized protein n=1 Tax=Timema tahoe TaxID=61484 RepID=A0A7R9P002_9NEOP|nr:unnamed protein product [Timema tahoe]
MARVISTTLPIPMSSPVSKDGKKGGRQSDVTCRNQQNGNIGRGVSTIVQFHRTKPLYVVYVLPITEIVCAHLLEEENPPSIIRERLAAQQKMFWHDGHVPDIAYRQIRSLNSVDALPIPYEKFKDLQQLKKFCGEEARTFYSQLPKMAPGEKSKKKDRKNRIEIVFPNVVKIQKAVQRKSL